MVPLASRVARAGELEAFMPYQATVYNVMIASPGDVQEERNIVRQVIHEWNDIHSEKTMIALRPVGWETSTSPVTGGRAQDIINTQILNSSDLLVAIFWTKLGTPTGNSESGTSEEIIKHIEAEKPAMIYFSETPVAPESLDQEQYNKLREFKSWCQDNGLIGRFQNKTEFKASFTRELQILVNKHPSFETAQYKEAQDTTTALKSNLSEESMTLLKEASKTETGQIFKLRRDRGYYIQTNQFVYSDPSNRRTAAIWEDAIEQLQREGYIKDVDYKGECFELTRSGYELADTLPDL